MAGPSGFELAIVAVLRNEAPYVEEWIAYHNLVGVEHFYLYENSSDDDIRTVLQRYIAHGLVTLIDFPIGGPQVPAYSHAVHCFAGSTEWLAPLDLDEFIVPKVDDDIPAMLRRLGDADRVVLPWRNFGMSGHRTRPPGLVIQNFVLAEDIPDGGFAQVPVKSIARASAIVSVGVHTQVVSSDRTVDADGAPAQMRYVKQVSPTYRSAQINHYVTKSEVEFAAKLARGDAARNNPRRHYHVEEERGFSTPDRSIERFVEPTRQRLADLRALSPNPYRYGSQVRMRLPHSDPFTLHATLAVSNYLHGMRVVRNGTRPLDNLMAGDPRAFVARVEDRHRGPVMWRFSDSPHFADLMRRLEGVVRQPTSGTMKVFESVEWSIELDMGDERLHLLIAAVVSVDAPTTLRWSARGAESADPVETQLPAPGRYVCVIEANRQVARCNAAVVEVATGGPATFDELCVVSYG